MPHFIYSNAKNGDDYLNPSIGTFCNDETGKRLKDMFFNKDTAADVRFILDDGEVEVEVTEFIP